MLSEFIQEQATLYTLGLLQDPEELDSFKKVMTAEPDLQALVTDLTEVNAAVLLATQRHVASANLANLKANILKRAAAVPQQFFPDHILEAFGEANFADISFDSPVVFADREARVQWINPAFTQMCGYTLEQAKGRRPGRMLQGRGTATEAVAALRHAIQNRVRVKQQLLNYRRTGEQYLVEIDLRPVSNGFVAVERELAIV
jgi:PAS domain S-box-containing protein